MARLRLFHLHRYANTLYRQPLRRSHATESPAYNPTAEQQLAFLRACDQQLLREIEQCIDEIINQINNVDTKSLELPTAISDESGIPEHMRGYLLKKVRDLPTSRDNAIANAEHLKAHLADLQYEPYPHRSKTETEEFEAEFAALKQFQKEDKLKELKLEELAAIDRSNKDGRELVRMVRDMPRKDDGTIDEPVRKRSPFARDASKKKLDGPAKEETKAASTPAVGLADEQRQLEASYSQTGKAGRK